MLTYIKSVLHIHTYTDTEAFVSIFDAVYRTISLYKHLTTPKEDLLIHPTVIFTTTAYHYVVLITLHSVCLISYKHHFKLYSLNILQLTLSSE